MHVFTNGTIITMAGSDVDAIAFDNGVITAVGEAAKQFIHSQGAIVHDLHGTTLMPGFIEPHGHIIQTGVFLSPPIIDIRPFVVATGAEVTNTVKEHIAKARPGEGLVFMGIDPLLHSGISLPSLQELDEMAPHNPIVIISNSGHAAFGNSLAFEKAGITKESQAPMGSTFVLDESGELSGQAQEVGAVFQLVAPFVPLDGAAMNKKIVWAAQQLSKAGITTTTELAYDRKLDPLMAEVAPDVSFPTRILAYQMSTPQLAQDETCVPPPKPAIGSRFGVIGMKMWADGSPWQGNIYTTFPYIDSAATQAIGLEPGHIGGMNYTPEQLKMLAKAFVGRGWQTACHVHGDAAADAVLDAYEEALAVAPHTDMRLRLEHCGALTPAQIQRAQKLGASISFFIAHVYYWGDVLVDGLFGPRGEQWMLAKSALDTGMRISFHNDGPVTPANPLGNICTAVTRRTKNSGRILDPAECISVEQALRAHTIDAAYHLHMDEHIGSLEVGKQADFVILSDDPRAVKPEQIRDIRVLTTFLGGRPMHQPAA